MEIEKYSNVRPLFKTGDILLFGGTSLFSKAIKAVTGSSWSHVGMVVAVKNWNMVLLWESTMFSKLQDVFQGEKSKGAALVPLSGKLRYCAEEQYTVAWRSLSREIDESELQAFQQHRKNFSGVEYQTNVSELIKSALDGAWSGDQKEDLTSVFCSELVALSYQKMGFLKAVHEGGLSSNEYTPRDFSSKSHLTFEKGVSLAKEVEIDFSEYG